MTEAPPHRLHALLAALTSGDDDQAQAALPGLARHPRQVLPHLLELLQSPVADHRWWATRALGALNEPSARAALEAALGDSDPAVRQCSALALGWHASAASVPGLLGALRDPDRLTARLAGAAMVAIGPEAIAALTVASQDPDPAVRIEAVRALASIDDPAVIPPLFRALEDSSSIVGHWAEHGLERHGVGMVFFQ